ncbi:Chemotaxis response regulator protein-glutamate methylesterase CheB [hydrothermal vent metagenome]|uniref:protein-glutamate methylesterase n=1 Tax=hydrothermal vent metagenome TaxID=652676 RepID=A0A3B0ZB32_9ZZZZ
MSIRILIVDDSAVVRKVLTDMLNGVSGFEVIAAARDPIFAQKKMEKEWPDVIILDVEMPRMDGLTFLKKIMTEHPTPVIMCSTLTSEGSHTALQALSIGAIDVVSKPCSNVKNSLAAASPELVHAIRVAAKANVNSSPIKSRRVSPDSKTAKTSPLSPSQVSLTKPSKLDSSTSTQSQPAPRPQSVLPPHKVAEKLTADVMLSKGTSRGARKTGAMIAIGASTGGTQALEAVLMALPKDTVPILIVQHMPESFTLAFAERLNSLCKVEVKEAEDNDLLIPGRVLIAPGGKHMLLQATSLGAFVQIKDGPLVCRHKPSVDVLFRSVSKFAGSNALGVIMTGMGDDGARGIKEMHDVGAKTIGQNEATCVVYGMPNEAAKLGAIDDEIDLDEIPEKIAAHK